MKTDHTWPKDAWKPIRKGDIYCSPACGGDCLYSDYTNAHKKGDAAAKKMGQGWTLRVWENLGWHWCITSPCKRITISIGYGSSTAYLHEPNEKCGGRYAENGKTPKAAMKRVIDACKEDLARIGAYIKGL